MKGEFVKMLYETRKMRGFRFKDINKLNKLNQQEGFSEEQMPEDDISDALSYLRGYQDARRPAMILSSPP